MPQTTSTEKTAKPDSKSQLFESVDHCQILDDPAALEFFGGDISGALEHSPVAVLQPETQEALEEIVRLCYKQEIAICCRGGGASYTFSHVPSRANSVIVDTDKMDRIIEINAENMTVTVEPGVTWEKLDQALSEQGLRTPFWGPFSGKKATVGGSISQHAISLGSARYGSSSQSVLGLKVVTGFGELIDTGVTDARFHRSYGPDLTGLFLGDSGAFGIKAEITFRLIKRPQVMETACFAYKNFEDMSNAMREVSRLDIASEIMALDPELQKGQFGKLKKTDLFSTAVSVLGGASNPVSGAISLLKTAFSMRRILKKPVFIVMYVVEGHSKAEARAKLKTLRDLAAQNAAEIANAMVIAMRSQPFIPFTPLLSIQGERWLPLHGVMPYNRICEFNRAYQKFLNSKKELLSKYKIRIAHMFLAVQQTAFVYEPTIYWPDSQNAAHIGMMPEDYRLSLPVHKENRAARDAVFQLRKEIIALLQEYGATHFQLGKTYPFLSTRESGSRKLFEQLKAEFDPNGILNPGVLEFESSAHHQKMS